MSGRATSRLAWGIWTASLALTGAALAASVAARPAGATRAATTTDALLPVSFLAFATVGAVLASRRPRNPIGWIFTGAALAITAEGFALAYADYGLAHAPTPLPGALAAAWLQSWVWIPTVGLALPLAVLLFPDGRAPSRRWLPVAWLAVAATAFNAGTQALAPGNLDQFPTVANPLGVGAPGGTLDTLVKASVGDLLMFAVATVCIASLVVRFRRAAFEERQQLKWFMYATLLLGAANVAVVATNGGAVGWALWFAAVIAMPVATAVAILKYRLYEIDRIISRTLVYGVLTALLAGLYFGIVIGLQAAFGSFTQGNELAVAGSTLAVAALFRPARRRIQELVDRRFYRSKVDAARMLATFSARLRREIDLDTLAAELRSVAQETMQPAHTSLWLRPPEAGR